MVNKIILFTGIYLILWVQFTSTNVPRQITHDGCHIFNAVNNWKTMQFIEVNFFVKGNI